MCIFVAVGANLTDAPVRIVRDGLQAFAQELGATLQESPLYITPAMPFGSGPDFVNGVVKVIGGPQDPATILGAAHRVEAQFGRVRDTRWGPRILDLDLLAVGDEVRPDAVTVRAWMDLAPPQQMASAPETLLLPHPRIQDRAFVLVPWADIAPNWCHPILNISLAQMLAALPRDMRAGIRPV